MTKNNLTGKCKNLNKIYIQMIRFVLREISINNKQGQVSPSCVF